MNDLADWLSGDLSTTGRVLSAIWPALLLLAYFLVAAAFYAVRLRTRGAHRDAEVEARGASVILGMPLRVFFAWAIDPIFRLVRWSEVPANAVTMLSALLSAGAGVSLAAGRFSLGGWLYLLAGLCDFLDGRLARATGTASKSGAALDSVLDRYSEAAILIGLAWYYRGSWVLMLTLLTLTGSVLVSYVRARGESLGVDVKMGLMQRPERVVLLGLGAAFSPVIAAVAIPTDPTPMHWLTVGVLLLLSLTTNITAVRRLTHIMRRLGVPPHPLVGRGSLVRSSISSAVATGADFLLVLAVVSAFAAPPWAATALGCLLGGIVNLSINRLWAFRGDGPLAPQTFRYAVVSISSALLNSGGVAILLMLPGLDYRLAWLIARGVVYLWWNYPLQRDYVFAPAAEPAPPGPPPEPRPAPLPAHSKLDHA